MTKLQQLLEIRKQGHRQNKAKAKADRAQAEFVLESATMSDLITAYKEENDLDFGLQLNIDELIKAERDKENEELTRAKERAKALQNGA